MNEFTAKKLGEVLAFAKVGNDTLDKGVLGFRKLFTEVKILDLKKENNAHILGIESLSETPDLKEIMLKKAKETSLKLSTIRNLYIKDEWGKPSELCEWFGFFEGAAVVHWTLIKGLGESIQMKSLEELADKAIIFHEEILKTASLSLYNIGKEKGLPA